jgi:hypothetical protein
VKLLGERLRKEGSCRGLDVRAAKFVSRLSEFQASEFQSKDQMVQSIEEVLGGERALKPERTKKPKPAKTARERRRGKGNWREGNSPAWAMRRTNWRLELVLVVPEAGVPGGVGEAAGPQWRALAAHPASLRVCPRTILCPGGGLRHLAQVGARLRHRARGN